MNSNKEQRKNNKNNRKNENQKNSAQTDGFRYDYDDSSDVKK